MKTSRLRLSASALAFLALAASACRADTIVVYTDITSYEAALSSYDQFNEPGSTVSVTHSYTLGPGTNGFGTTASTDSALFPADGVDSSGNQISTHTILSTGGPEATLDFGSFQGSPDAFGGFFYSTGTGQGTVISGQVALSINGTTETVTTPSSDMVPFYGFIDETGPITSVTMVSSDGVPTADRVIIGFSAVPEPSSAVMAGTGLALALACRLRRRRRVAAAA